MTTETVQRPRRVLTQGVREGRIGYAARHIIVKEGTHAECGVLFGFVVV